MLRPTYPIVTARLLLHNLRLETLGSELNHTAMKKAYARVFPDLIRAGIEAELLDSRLGEFDLSCLGAALDHSRDFKFGYLGLQILYDRYFLHVAERRIEPYSLTVAEGQ